MLRHIRDHYSRYYISERSRFLEYAKDGPDFPGDFISALTSLHDPRTIAEGGLALRKLFLWIDADFIRIDFLHTYHTLHALPRLMFVMGHEDILKIFLEYALARLSIAPDRDQLQAIFALMKELFDLDLNYLGHWLRNLATVLTNELISQIM